MTGDDSGFWERKAGTCLAALCLAAALGGHGLDQVAAWVCGDASGAEAILQQHGRLQAAARVAELHGEAPRSAASIRMIMVRALPRLRGEDQASDGQ